MTTTYWSVSWSAPLKDQMTSILECHHLSRWSIWLLCLSIFHQEMSKWICKCCHYVNGDNSYGKPNQTRIHFDFMICSLTAIVFNEVFLGNQPCDDGVVTQHTGDLFIFPASEGWCDDWCVCMTLRSLSCTRCWRLNGQLLTLLITCLYSLTAYYSSHCLQARWWRQHIPIECLYPWTGLLVSQFTRVEF